MSNVLLLTFPVPINSENTKRISFAHLLSLPTDGRFSFVTCLWFSSLNVFIPLSLGRTQLSLQSRARGSVPLKQIRASQVNRHVASNNAALLCPVVNKCKGHILNVLPVLLLIWILIIKHFNSKKCTKEQVLHLGVSTDTL